MGRNRFMIKYGRKCKYWASSRRGLLFKKLACVEKTTQPSLETRGLPDSYKTNWCAVLSTTHKGTVDLKLTFFKLTLDMRSAGDQWWLDKIMIRWLRKYSTKCQTSDHPEKPKLWWINAGKVPSCPRERSSRHWPWKVKLSWVSHPPSMPWVHSAATTRVAGPSINSQVLPHGADGGRKGGGCVPTGRLVTALGVWMAVCAIFALGHRIVCVAKDLPFVYSKLPCAVCPFIGRRLKNMHVGWIMHLWNEIWMAFRAFPQSVLTAVKGDKLTDIL